jgi:signal transduction histidine kinase
MRIRPRSLRAIMLLYVGVVGAILLAVRGANYVIIHDALNREVDRRLALEAREVTGMTPGGTIADMARRITAKERAHQSADLLFQLRDRAGRPVAGALRLTAVPPPGYSDFGDTAGIDGVTHGRALVQRVGDGATLVIVSDNDVVDAFDARLFEAQLIGLIVALVLFAGGGAAIVFEVSRRLRRMQDTVDAVMAGNLASRIPVDGSRNEFDRQATAFNAMLDRIDALMANVKHAARDVAHELKSPLARLRTQVGAMARRAEGTPLAEDSAAILAETDDVLELFASLMRLWEIEGGQRRSRFVRLDLGQLVRDVGETLRPVAEDAGMTLELAVEAEASLRGEPRLLRQLVVNLIENAIRHTSPGTHITMFMRRVSGSVEVGVVDDGPGIPLESHDAVIRRFGRLEASDDRPGHGLGLTLVDAIARLHGGVLRLEDAAPGLRAVVALPALP